MVADNGIHNCYDVCFFFHAYMRKCIANSRDYDHLIQSLSNTHANHPVALIHRGVSDRQGSHDCGLPQQATTHYSFGKHSIRHNKITRDQINWISSTAEPRTSFRPNLAEITNIYQPIKFWWPGVPKILYQPI